MHGAPVEAIFRLSSNGVKTQRDDWMWAHDRRSLAAKAKALISAYEAVRTSAKGADASSLKWDVELDRSLKSGVNLAYDKGKETSALVRPFNRAWLYFDAQLNGRTYKLSSLFRPHQANPALIVSDRGWRSQFSSLATDTIPDLHALASVDGFQVVTRYRYIKSGERVDNITDWALRQFRTRYGDNAITKDDIFAYCYAALHDPVFREVHAADLRREFPRVKLHDDFARWRDWGRTLLKLHIGYEKVKPWKLERVDTPGKRAPALKLKSDPQRGAVVVDSETQLTGIPPEAWNYRLGNRSAIDWVLDQHKEKKPRDPTVAAKFNTYRFADHKESMIKLLAKVVRVSVETVAITEAMKALDPSVRENNE
jgi:predicted helicase